MQTITIKQKVSQKRAPVEAGVTVKFGLDVHAAQITVCRQIDGQVPQPAQKFGWTECVEWIDAHVKAGAVVHACYEAGPCGYGLHRQLTKLGVTNHVVVPQRWDEQNKRVKTDARDARALCDRLDRYAAGNTTAFSIVRVPTPEQEQRRALGRQRDSLVRERQRCVVRGHGLMLAQGVRAPGDWWIPKIWEQFRLDLPEWLRPQILVWQESALRMEVEVKRWTCQVVAQATERLIPKGVGTLTHALLAGEILDWHRFKNRGQVASYTGLCPSEYSSGERPRQGAITKHGNPRVRHQLVEAVWRLLQWQPDYPPLRKLRAAVGKRTRKRLAVAAARRLAIDLWRINTGQCTAEKLGLKLA
jgi:transposase